jgi:hypothetical protein
VPALYMIMMTPTTENGRIDTGWLSTTLVCTT